MAKAIIGKLDGYTVWTPFDHIGQIMVNLACSKLIQSGLACSRENVNYELRAAGAEQQFIQWILREWTE